MRVGGKQRSSINPPPSKNLTVAVFLPWNSPFRRDPILMTAQITSILAACIVPGYWFYAGMSNHPWMWQLVIFLPLTICVLLQNAWCMPIPKLGFYVVAILAYCASMIWLYVGIWDILHEDVRSCLVNLLSAILFHVIAISSTYFVRTRYDAIVTRQQQQSPEQAQAHHDDIIVPSVEMGDSDANLGPIAIATPLPSPGKPTVLTV